MVSDDTLLILGAAGLGAYFLLKKTDAAIQDFTAPFTEAEAWVNQLIDYTGEAWEETYAQAQGLEYPTQTHEEAFPGYESGSLWDTFRLGWNVSPLGGIWGLQ